MLKIKTFLFWFLKIIVSAGCLYGALVCYTYSFLISALFLCLVPIIVLFFPLFVRTLHLLNGKEFFSILLMIISCLFSFKSYTYIHDGFWKDTLKTFTIVPGFLPLVFAILLYVSLFVKGFISIPKNVYNYLIMVCDIIFLSSFMTIFISNEKWKLFGLFELPFTAQTLAILAILISYLGIKAVSGFAWIALFICGFSHLMEIDSAMGLYVIPYIICAFISILLQVQDESKFKELIRNGLFSSKKVMGQVKKDVEASGKVVQDTVASFSSAVVSTATGVPVGLVNSDRTKISSE